MNHSKTTLTAGVGHKAHFSLCMLFAGCAALFAMAASAASDNNWRKVYGDANGAMNETDHWTSGAPTLDHFAVFPGSLGSYTVTIPAEYELKSNFRANVVDGETLTLDWRGGRFYQPQLPSDATIKYNNEPFSFRYKGSHFVNLQTYLLSQLHALSDISNAVVRLSATGGHPRLDFDQGEYNFVTPDGSTEWNAYFFLFADGQGGAHKPPSSFNSEVHFHEGTSTTFPRLMVQCCSYTNVLSFDGGTHVVNGAVTVPDNSQKYTEHAHEVILRVADTANVTLNNTLTIGASSDYYGQTTNQHATVVVENGGKLELKKAFTQDACGALDVIVRNGGELTTRDEWYMKSSPGFFTGRVSVVNAKLNLKGRLSVGSTANATCRETSGFYATNSVINLSGSGYIQPVGADVVIVDSDLTNATVHCIETTNDTQMTFLDSRVVNNAQWTFGSATSRNNTTFDGCDVLSTAEVIPNGGTTTFTNSHVVISNSTTFTKGASNSPKVVFAGDDNVYQQWGSLNICYYSDTKGEVVFRGGTNSLMGSVYVGSSSRTEGRMTVEGGVVKVFTRPDHPEYSSFAYLGQQDDAYGILDMKGGSLTSSDASGLQIGWKGSGEANISGGTTTLSRVRFGTASSSTTKTNRLVQTGGVLDVVDYGSGFGIDASSTLGRIGLVQLDGGVTKCGRFYPSAGTGLFRANGGKIVAKGANVDFFYNFAEAKIGSCGLEIESDYNVTAAQDFADADGEDGLLVLSGTGVKTLTGTSTELARVEVTGGKAVLPAAAQFGTVVAKNGATVAFSGALPAGAVGALVLGDADTAGVLTVREGEAISVGELVATNVQLVLEGEFTSGEVSTDYALITVAGTMSAESKDAWARAVATSGLVDGDIAEFSWVEAGGTTTLKMNVRKPRTLRIELASGTSNATANVSYQPGETLVADVADGANLTLSGQYGTGAFAKTGDGRAQLVNTANDFINGVTLYGGILSVPDTAAFGLGNPLATAGLLLTNGTLEVTGPAQGAEIARLGVASAPTNILYSGNYYLGHDAVIVKSDVDVVAPVPTPATAAFIKRGVGKLTLTADAAGRFPNTYGHTRFGQEVDATTWIFPANGSAPSALYSALNIAEGEMAFRGTGAEPVEIGVGGSILVGVPTKNLSAQPALTVDNLKLVNMGSGTRFHLAPQSTETISDVTEATVTLTNNATISVDTVQVNYSGTRSGMKVHVNADHSDFIATYMLYASRGSSPDVKYFFRNGARLLVNNCSIYGNVTFDFDNSVLAKNTGLGSVSLASYGSGTVVGYVFRNGSEFRCSELRYASSGTATGAYTLTFDNSKWIPGIGDFTFSFPGYSNLKVVVENEGLVLEPPAGKTWTVSMPIEGTGGMVVGGAGTVSLDGEKWTATGVVNVQDGATLDLGGTTAAGLVVGGAGTVSGGTISRGGMKVSLADDGTVTSAIPTFDGMSFSKLFKVDVSRGGSAARLAKPYRTVVVADYTGSAPDVSGWRMRNAGESGLGARFEAHDGHVYMTPKVSGVILIVK